MSFSKYYWVSFTASGAVLTSVAHNLYVDDTVMFATTVTLPTGLSANTTYYVVSDGLTADTFGVSATKRGTVITTTGAGSGTNTFLKTNAGRIIPNVENNA
jgi:translation initiation factor RLI1